MKALEKYVAELCGCSVEEMASPSRRREAVNARKICMAAMRDYTDASSTDIGGYFNRDHATALCAIKKARDHYRNERDFRAVMDAVYDACREDRVQLPFAPPVEYIASVMSEEELLICQLT